MNVFTMIRDNAPDPLGGRCRCVVDSTVSIFFVHGIEKLVSFSLLLREISMKMGISSILVSSGSIGRRVNSVLEYNCDLVAEFKSIEEGEQLSHKMRVKRTFGQLSSSPWIKYDISGNEVSIQGDNW